jgi:hypothetical protein
MFTRWKGAAQNVTPTRRFFKPLRSRCTPSTRRRSSATSPCSPSSGVQPKPDVHEQDSHVQDSGRSSVALATQCMRPSCWADWLLLGWSDGARHGQGLGAQLARPQRPGVQSSGVGAGGDSHLHAHRGYAHMRTQGRRYDLPMDVRLAHFHRRRL